jgi:Zn-finger nucleic acid-binding protein
MKCPVCDVTLVISSREGIEIDHCPQCRGVWLDRGELDKIIERAAPSVVGAPVGGRDDYDDRPRRDDRDRGDWDDRDRDRRPRDDDRSYKRKKRRSFLEDIFEFD